MASVSLIDPYSQKAEEIANRRRMAQALQEQGSQVLDMPTTPGVAISPYAGLAKVFQQMYGAYQDKQARKEYADLQNEYRTNYNTQLGEMARLISAPEVKGVAGQQAIEPQASVQEPIYATKPENLTAFGSGMGTQQDKDKILGWETTVPRIAGQPAIAPVEARPAGYISAADLEKIDIPEVKQLLMAKYLKQFEPQQVTLGDNQRLLERTGGGGFKEVVGAAKTPTTATLSSLGKLQSERNAIFAINPNDPRLAELNAAIAKETKTETTPPTDLARLLAERAAIATKNPTDPSLATYDSAIEKLTQDKNLAFQKEKFEYEKAYPGYSYEKVKNLDGTETIQAINKTTGVARPVRTGTGEALTSAAPVKKIRMDITNPDGSTKTILTDENDPKFKEGFVTKGPNYANITEVNEKGETVIRQVEQNDPILKTGYVKPLEGFFGQLQALGVPIKDWKNNPALSDMVNRYFVKGVGGSDIEAVAGYDLQKMKVLAELAYEGIKVPQAVLDKLNIKATPGLLGGAQSTSAAAPTPAIAKAPPKINDVVVNGDKKFRFKGGDPNQQSNWVEVK